MKLLTKTFQKYRRKFVFYIPLIFREIYGMDKDNHTMKSILNIMIG